MKYLVEIEHQRCPAWIYRMMRLLTAEINGAETELEYDYKLYESGKITCFTNGFLYRVPNYIANELIMGD